MNVQKLIAILVAVAINCAVLAGFHSWSTAIIAHAAVSPASASRVITLPAIDVHPSAAQLRALRNERPAALPARANVSDDRSDSDATMPYYSFAADVDVAGNG